jgi:DNA repair protein RecO (recombination protein O)
MDLRSPAILCASRPQGETAAIAKFLTPEHGLVAAYVAGARGRNLRPLLIPGNLVEIELRSRTEAQLPFARVELVQSRGPWLGEPIPAAAFGWATALTASTLPERHAYPALYAALAALLDAVCAAPSARGWVPGLIAFETLLLREMGYGGSAPPPPQVDWAATLAAFDALGPLLAAYALAERHHDVMGARAVLRERLARIG